MQFNDMFLSYQYNPFYVEKGILIWMTETELDPALFSNQQGGGGPGHTSASRFLYSPEMGKIWPRNFKLGEQGKPKQLCSVFKPVPVPAETNSTCFEIHWEQNVWCFCVCAIPLA